MLHNIAGFPYIYISQGSVATQLRCGEIFNNHLIANWPLNWAVKEFRKSVNIREDMDNKKAPRFLAHPVDTYTVGVYHRPIQWYHGIADPYEPTTYRLATTYNVKDDRRTDIQVVP